MKDLLRTTLAACALALGAQASLAQAYPSAP